MESTNTSGDQTSIWIKIIAVCAVLMVLFFGYSAFSASKNDQCRINAMQPYALIEILDTKWSTAGCAYLVKHEYTDSPPAWQSHYFLDIYAESERKSTE